MVTYALAEGWAPSILAVKSVAEEVGQIEESLRSTGFPLGRLEHAESLSRGLERLGKEAFDLILVDLWLPDSEGLETVRRVQEAAADVPILVLTEEDDEWLGLEAVALGAQDYIPKAEVNGRRLARAIRHAAQRKLRENDRRRAEEKEQVARRMAERAIQIRDDVLGLVAHDLRNPLGAISTYATLMQEVEFPVEQRRKYLRAVGDSAIEMDRLIGDLLDVSRIEAGRLRIEVDDVSAMALLGAARRAHTAIAGEKGLRLICTVAGGLPAVRADRGRIGQVFANLIGNAVKFTERGGTIRLSAKRAGGHVCFTVADTGQGIAQQDLPYIFDRFWQAKSNARGGAGLGLAIARGIVEAHGGHISVESRMGHGTAFHFTLPAAIC
jgi:signal transduction histidine kinase